VSDTRLQWIGDRCRAAHDTSNTAREFLSQLPGIQISREATDLEKLRLFLEAARKLNTAGVLDEILMTMLDVTVQLTSAARGFVFLKEDEGRLRLAAGRNHTKETLLDDKTISHSILEESMRSNLEFLLTDTSQSIDLSGRQSIVANDLRTVICIPLRRILVQATRHAQAAVPAASAIEAMGVLYVDSRCASRDMSGVSEDILHVIATEAASPSRSSPTTSPPTPTGSAVSRRKPAPSPRSTTRTSSLSTTLAPPTAPPSS
jgi:sigma-B regulation protein RsbU (phosphoserine phosphatase)